MLNLLMRYVNIFRKQKTCRVVCVCSCVCTSAYMPWPCMHLEARHQQQNSFFKHLTLFEMRSLVESGAHRLDKTGQPASPRNLPDYRHLSQTWSFTWGSEFSASASTSSNFPTDPTLQPQDILNFKLWSERDADSPGVCIFDFARSLCSSSYS